RDRLGDDDGAPPGGRPGPFGPKRVRARAAYGGRRHPLRRGGRGRRVEPGARARPALPGLAHRVAARVGHPGLLRRLHLRPGRQPARRADRHGQDPDAGRADPAAGLPGGGGMKLRGNQTNGREPHTLAGAYAMDAISEPDRASFERHLAGCEECAQEIAGLREATARLATATAVPPPSGLKERVIAAAALTRQQPPPAAEASAEAPARVPGIVPWFRALALPRRMALAAAGLAAVAVLAVAVAFGVANGSMRDQLSAAQASSQQVAAVLTAHDATMMTGAVAGGGTATIVMSHAMHALVFTAAGLRAPGGGSPRPHRRTHRRRHPPHRPDDARRPPVVPVHPAGTHVSCYGGKGCG